MWIPILEGYKHPTHEYLDEPVPKPLSRLTEEEKKAYDLEKKAHALQKRFEGNNDVKKSKKELLRKQYECFKHLENESTDDLISRFYHLLTELKSYEVKYPEEDLGEKFLDALPPKFDMYTTLLRENSKFYEMTIDTEDDHTNGCVNSTCFAASGFNSSRGPSSLSAHQNVIAKISKDHVALFASCMLAYENFIGGKLSYPETIEEDFNQVDPDDMENVDIQWNMAMILRRAKRFLKITGRKFIGGHPNARVGLDKSKAKCYKCQNLDTLQGKNQIGLVTEIVELMEAEGREAAAAAQQESAFALMSIGESSSTGEIDSNAFDAFATFSVSCLSCEILKDENDRVHDQLEPLRCAALNYKENEKTFQRVN
ncbi:hypothetical protein L1987_20402 [Smallanthus sonchifolius]|uniref:Uncharacterized protein n=1 Tax=Smallanthus sonchifolius TaxID=185202 RepID=A0ACB9IRZ1_9ASTR|nr:hypothetical protein L1987_20402 [Smallanthus sonchifolius]